MKEGARRLRIRHGSGQHRGCDALELYDVVGSYLPVSVNRYTDNTQSKPLIPQVMEYSGVEPES